MLRPWSSSITMGIACDGIALETARQSARLLSRDQFAFNSHDELIQILLAHADSLKGHRVNLVLSNALVRYLVLPWQAQVSSRSDWQAIAQQAFQQQFGTDASDWQIRVDLDQFGSPVVANAMHGALYDALQNAARLIGFEWNSITPNAIGLLKRLNPQPHSWMLVAEPEYLLLCMRDKAGVLNEFVVASPLAGEEAQKAAQLVARLITQNGHAPKQTVAYVSGKLSADWREHAKMNQTLSPVYARNTHDTNASWLTQVPR